MVWNMSEGKVVEGAEIHGTLDGVALALRGSGLVIQEVSARRSIPGSRTDVAFVKARKDADGDGTE